MKQMTMGQIEKAISGRLLQGNTDEVVHGISIDSRTVKENDVFFALIGQHFDGHEFLPEVIKKGVKHVVISDPDALVMSEAVTAIQVEDTEKALGHLASWYLDTLNMKKVAITGSTGKTSTKDILAAICSEKFKTAKTMGNFNNHIGVPLTIFSFDEGVEVGIIEMGAETLGEIHSLVQMVKPDIAIITNVGISHIETFGSRENILKGKMEVKDFFKEDNLLIINGESDLLTIKNAGGTYRLETVGCGGKHDYILSDIIDMGEEGVEFTLEKSQERNKYQVNIPGRHNAINASLAIAAAMDLGVSAQETINGLKKAVLTEKRLNIKGKNGLKVIDDTYNASPDSMRAGIEVLMVTKGMRKVAILGDMLGLGEKSQVYHAQIGEYVASRGVDQLIAIGTMAKHMANAAKEKMGNQVFYFKNKEEFFPVLKKLITPGDVIFVKGSRDMAMERIVKKILE